MDRVVWRGQQQRAAAMNLRTECIQGHYLSDLVRFTLCDWEIWKVDRLAVGWLVRHICKQRTAGAGYCPKAVTMGRFDSIIYICPHLSQCQGMLVMWHSLSVEMAADVNTAGFPLSLRGELQNKKYIYIGVSSGNMSLGSSLVLLCWSRGNQCVSIPFGERTGIALVLVQLWKSTAGQFSLFWNWKDMRFSFCFSLNFYILKFWHRPWQCKDGIKFSQDSVSYTGLS